MATNHQEYRDLVAMLHTTGSPEKVYTLEYIPEGIDLHKGKNYQIVDSVHIGIPRKVIAKAFLTAHKIFFAYMDDYKNHIKDLMDASMIILLHDPEHLTAANLRKRIIVYRDEVLDPRARDYRSSSDDFWLTELFLMSKLKRHNKSPTLWAHRKWLVKRNYKRFCPTPRDREFDGHEITILVPKSGENHPRNYYAWDYLRWFLEFRPPIPDEPVDPTESDEDDPYLQGKSLWDFDENGMERIFMEWCYAHTSDISGWSFLFYLHQRRYYKSGSHGWILKAHCANETLVRAQSMGMKNESLWQFLSMMKNEGKMTNVREMEKYVHDFMVQVRRFDRGEPDGSPMKKFARRELRIESADNMRELYEEQMAMME